MSKLNLCVPLNAAGTKYHCSAAKPKVKWIYSTKLVTTKPDSSKFGGSILHHGLEKNCGYCHTSKNPSKSDLKSRTTPADKEALHKTCFKCHGKNEKAKANPRAPKEKKKNCKICHTKTLPTTVPTLKGIRDIFKFKNLTEIKPVR